MPALYEIAVGATRQTLAAWGIAAPVLTRRSLAADELTFTEPLANVLVAPTFPYGTLLRLFRDDVCIFVGTVRREPSAGSGASERRTYTAYNAWWELERIVYQQARCVVAIGGGITTQLTPRVVLGQTSLGGQYVTTTAQVQAVITYALTQGTGMAAGTIAGGVPFLQEEALSLTCAEVIRRMAAYTPDCVASVGYASESPVLTLARNTALTPVARNLLAADLIKEWRVEKRDDLIPAGVRFLFADAHDDPANGKTLARLATQSAGAPDGVGGLITIIDLAGSTTSQAATAPAGAAAAYYAALLTPIYEGELTTHALDCDGSLGPGVALNLTSGRTAWATMRAPIQVVIEDLTSGITRAEFGPSPRLPARDFVDQLLFARRQRVTTNFQAVRNCRRKGPDIGDAGNVPDTGGQEEDNPAAGEDVTRYNDYENLVRALPELQAALQATTQGTVDLIACEGGVEVTYRLLGAALA